MILRDIIFGSNVSAALLISNRIYIHSFHSFILLWDDFESALFAQSISDIGVVARFHRFHIRSVGRWWLFMLMLLGCVAHELYIYIDRQTESLCSIRTIS